MYKYLISLALLCFSCQITDSEIEADMIDGDSIVSPAIYDSSYYLISDSLSTPSEAEKLKPVLVAAHGFSASAWQLQELRDFSDSTEEFLVSLVTLGGHGTDYNDFKTSTWQDWQKPIITEYEKLIGLGYQNISLLGASTGGTLILEGMHNHKFTQAPQNIFLIDPIIIPGDKILSLADWVNPILGNDVSPQKGEERNHTYSNRPVEALDQLTTLINQVRIDLEDGWKLPVGTQAKTWKAKIDASADPLSALVIKRGLYLSDGSATEVELVESNRHIFIQSNNRSSWSEEQKQLQQKTFLEIQEQLIN